jgi:hypothetical protein
MKSGQIGDVLVTGSFHFMRFRVRVLKLGVLGGLLLLLSSFFHLQLYLRSITAQDLAHITMFCVRIFN